MFEAEKQKIQDFRKLRNILNIFYVALKLSLAYAIITYIDFGIFIVIGYILFSLESAIGLQFINSQEVDLQLNILHQKIDDIENKLNQLGSNKANAHGQI